MAVDSASAKSLFLTASDMADPAKRAVFLDKECGPNAELRARVEALLKANDALPLSPPDSAVATLGGASSGPIGPESILTAEYRTKMESGIVVSNRNSAFHRIITFGYQMTHF